LKDIEAAMVLILYRLRAFTDKAQGGNPAGVICFEQFPSAEQLQQLAWQSAQPVTAMVAKVTGGYQIRWYTPQQEINLCGHGTLAAAAVVFAREPALTVLQFFSEYGDIVVRRHSGGFSLCLPVFTLTPVAVKQLPLTITQGNAVAAASGRDLILELASLQQVVDYQPDFSAISKLPWHALLVTALDTSEAEPCYWLRYFAPSIGINEDPATGSAHCSLLPYWVGRIAAWQTKNALQPLKEHPQQGSWRARQCSAEGGEFQLRLKDGQVELTSQAVLLGEVALELPA
jgi:predicted PhzF superfamily epimerase YddE/YHI9